MRRVTSLLLLMLLLTFTWQVKAQTSAYTFESSSGTYTEITGGTVLAPAGWDDQLILNDPLGFTFNYNGADYTTVTVNANGYLIIGGTASMSYTPISSTTVAAGSVAAFGRDLQSITGTGEIRSETSGTSGDYVYTLQWKNAKRYGTSYVDEILNFQIKLYENGNKAEIVYGSITGTAYASPVHPQVGMRGATNADYSNRTTTTSWAATTAGAVNTATCTLTNLVFPASGQTFTFNPPAAGTPLPPSNPIPANASIGVPVDGTLDWTFGENTATYDLWFGSEGAMVEVVTGAVADTTGSYAYSGLMNSNTYQWQVIEYNGAMSTAGPVWSFVSACGVEELPFAENFDGDVFPPFCWTKHTGLLNDTTILTPSTSGWFKDDWLNVTGSTDKAAKANIWSTSFKYWLVTPEIDLGDGSMDYQMEFDLALMAYGGSNPPALTGVDDKFAVVISLDGGVSWYSANTLRLYDNAGSAFVYNEISNLGQRTILSLSGYTGVVKLGFYGESTLSNADNELMINNLLIRTPPACLEPSVLIAQNPTINSVDLSWTPGADETAWDISYGDPGFLPENGTIVPAATNPFTLTGLTAATSYEVYVRADCGTDEVSAWIGPVAFVTECYPIAIPFAESFDGEAFPPVCWHREQTAGTGAGLWDRQTAGTYPTCVPHSGAAMTRFNCFSYTAGTAGILVTPAFDVTVNTVGVNFWMYRDGGYLTNADRVNVYYNTEAGLTDAVLLGTVNRSINLEPVVDTTSWYQYTFASPSGVMGDVGYFILEGVSGYGNNIFVDDVEVFEPQVGTLAGTVSEASKGVIQGAMITAGSSVAYTDEFGDYEIPGLLPGYYDVTCEAEGYFAVSVDSVEVVVDLTTTQDFVLGYAQIVVTPTSLLDTLPPDGMSTQTLTISNPGGTESLNWSASIELLEEAPLANFVPVTFGDPIAIDNSSTANDVCATTSIMKGDLTDAAWDVLQSFSTFEAGEQAVGTDGQYIYTTKWNAAGVFGKYALDGTFMENFTIASAAGIRDFAYDGQYFYGGASGATLFILDFTTQTQVGTIALQGGATCRHLAYDPSIDGFWVGNWTTLFQVDKTGAVLQTGPAVVSVYGSAYDGVTPGGPYLWLFAQVGTDGCGDPVNDLVTLQQFDIATMSFTGVVHCATDLPGYIPGVAGAATISGGAFTTDLLFPGKFVMMVNVQQSPNLVGVYELATLDSWLSLDTYNGTIAPGATQDVTVSYDAAGLIDTNYYANININHNGQELSDGTLTVPVELIVASAQAPQAATDPMPATGAQLVPFQPEFSWTNGAGTATTRLVIKVVSGPFTPTIYTSPWIIGNSIDLADMGVTLLPKKTYLWQVSCRNAAGATPSASWTFTTIGVGTIGGIVTDNYDGAPLEGVTVSTDDMVYSATTGVDGTYSITGVIEGDYNLTAELEDYVSQSTTVTVVHGQLSPTNFALDLYLDPPFGLRAELEDFVNVNLSWYAPGTIIGGVIFEDNFDTYTAGEQLACQNPTDWTTWSAAPCGAEDAFVSSLYANSGANSIVIAQNNDLVKDFGDPYTYGKYSISFNAYIPTGNTGYFNTLQSFVPLGTTIWGIEVYFNAAGAGSINANGTATAAFTWLPDTWFAVEHIVDLDADLSEIWINGEMIYSWQWSLGATGVGQNTLDANDFFGALATDQMYIDDYKLEEISAKTTGRELLSYNIYKNGEQFANTELNEYSDLNLDPGTYAYTVKAVYPQGESEAVGPETVAILAPPVLLSADADYYGVDLVWEDGDNYPENLDTGSNYSFSNVANDAALFKAPSTGVYDKSKYPDMTRQGGDSIDDALVIGSFPYTDNGTTSGYTNNYDEACPYTGGTAPDVVYSYVAPSDMMVTISLCQSAYDTKVYVYENAYTPGEAYACNDDLCGLQSEISGLGLTAGNTYYIVVDGYGTSNGDYVLELFEYVECVVECPPDAIAEGEPCGDDLNGGCNAEIPTYEPIASGDVICGTAFADGTTRDTDWYEFVIDAPKTITWTATAEFPVLIFIVKANSGNCLDYQILSSNTAAPCETAMLTATVPPGTYWVLVMPSVFEGIQCGIYNNYVAELTLEDAFLSYYNVFRDGVDIADVYTGTTYRDEDIVNGDEYCYTVSKVESAAFETGLSNQLCPTVPLIPEIVVNPESFSKTLYVGTTEMEALTIENTGSGVLDFTVDVNFDSKGRNVGDLNQIKIIPADYEYVNVIDRELISMAKTAKHTPSPNMTDDDVIRYDDGVNFDAIGLTTGATFQVSAYWPASSMGQYAGMKLSQVEVYINDVPNPFVLKIYGAGTLTVPGELLHEQTAIVNALSWNVIELSQPVDITGDDIWIGYEVTHLTGEYPAGCDAGPAIAGFGDMISLDGLSFEPMSGLGLDFNWNIAATLVSGVDSWLTVNPLMGSIDGIGQVDLGVTFDAGAVEPGFYTATINITSNDPLVPMVSVPVELEVYVEEGILVGYVMDATSRSPVQGVTITAEEIRYSATTDDQGYYEMVLPKGLYSVTAAKDGYISQTVDTVLIVYELTTQQDFMLDFAAPELLYANGGVGEINLGWASYSTKRGLGNYSYANVQVNEDKLHGPTVKVPYSSGRAIGDDCTAPIVIGSLPFVTMDSTCGRGNFTDSTCLNFYDGGEDIFYMFTLTEATPISIVLETTTTYTGMLISSECPPSEDCIAIATNSASGGVQIERILQAGTYYIMIDTWPSPACIPDFTLTVSTFELCQVECPAGSMDEGELCGEDLNGGCNAVEFAVVPVTDGDVICGTAWADGGSKDTDWYELVITGPKTVTWSVNAEFPVDAFIIDGNFGCEGSYIIAVGESDTCSEAAVATADLPPGTYWLWVGDQTFEGNPCGNLNDYVAEVTCTDTFITYFNVQRDGETIDQTYYDFYVDTDIMPDTEYCYTVNRVVEPGLITGESNELCATMLCEVACDYVLNFYDDWGDGWNGASVSIIQDGNMIGSYTLTTGVSGSQTVTLCDAVETSLVWSAGSYDYECGFELFDTEGMLITSFEIGAAPVAGEFFNFTTACPAIPEQIIALEQGWNAWSSYLNPDSRMGMEDMMAPVIDQMVVTQYFNQLLYPAYGINTMGDFSNNHGYFTKMTEAATLPISGFMADPTVMLTQGWNLMPVLQECSIPAADVFSNLPGLIIAWEVGNGIYYPDGNLFTLVNLNPGMAYWVKVDADVSYTYPGCEVKGRSYSSPLRAVNNTNWNDVNYTPVNHAVVFDANATLSLQAGDMIGAFTTNGWCAGLVEFTENNFGFNLFGNDMTTDMADGFVENENLSYRLFRPATDEEFDIEVTYSFDAPNADGLFAINGVSIVTDLKLSPTSIGANLLNGLNIYPNPSSGIFNIALNNIDENINFVVMNVQGQEVYRGNLLETQELDLSAEPRGVYFIKFMNNGVLGIEKLVIK